MLSSNISVTMRDLNEYITNEIGLPFHIWEKPTDTIGRVPLYLRASYIIQAATLVDTEITLLFQQAESEPPTVGQMVKHAESLRLIVNRPVVFVFAKLEAYKRKRMVQQRINFIVPYKQLYLPELTMAFLEQKKTIKTEAAQFSPMAQLLVFYWLLGRPEDAYIEQVQLNEIAVLFETNAMAITRAAGNLAELGICKRTSGRTKSLQFCFGKAETWNSIKQRNLAINPVQKTVFIDERPPAEQVLTTNINALAVYTDLNPVVQNWYAIDKTAYQAYKKTNQWPHENQREGRFAIEVWKYNPALLQRKLPWLANNADPLSLYCCFANDTDERVQEALVQLEKQQTWLEE